MSLFIPLLQDLEQRTSLFSITDTSFRKEELAKNAFSALRVGSEANPSICGCLPNKMTGGQKCDEDG